MNLQRELNLQVKGNTYKVEFPTVGKFLDIESTKIKVSRNEYGGFIQSLTRNSLKALDFVDMISYFSVLVPNLLKDLKSDSYLDLDVMDANELLTVYKENFNPWIESWLKVLRGDEKKENKDE